MVRHFPPCNSNDRKPFSGTARAKIPIAQTIARLYGMRSRADKSCPSRHQNALPFKVSHESLLFCLLQQMLSFKLSIHRGRVGSYHLDKEGIFKRLCHPRNLLRPKLGVNRQRQEPIGQLLRDGKVTLPVSKVGIGLLQMDGNRIVDTRSDTGCMERLLHVITLLELDGIHMVDVPSMCWRRR